MMEVYSPGDENAHKIQLGKCGDRLLEINLNDGWHIAQVVYDDTKKDNITVRFRKNTKTRLTDMNYIELNELYYSGGSYLTRPFLCNVDEIATAREERSLGYAGGTVIYMKNGRSYEVADKYKDIVERIVRVSSRERDDDK